MKDKWVIQIVLASFLSQQFCLMLDFGRKKDLSRLLEVDFYCFLKEVRFFSLE